MRRLALRLPTALHIRGTYALLFHEGGVSELTQLDGNPEYNALYPPPDQISRKIWVLIDSNPALPEPAAIFKCPSPFFVVGAVSPRSGCLGWLKKAKAQYFYMNLWSAKEVLQRYMDLAPGGSQHSRSLQPPVPRYRPLHRTSTFALARCVWRISQGPGSLCR